MKPLAAEVFGLPEERVLRSREPQRTIGSGLAIYHVLKRRQDHKRKELEDSRPAILDQFGAALRQQIDGFVSEVPRKVLAPLMERIEPLFLAWYSQGGSLRDVESRIEQVREEARPVIDWVLDVESVALGRAVLELMRQHLARWLAEQRVERNVDQFIGPTLPVGGGVALVEQMAGDLASPLAVAFTASLATTVVAVIAAVKLTLLTTLSLVLLAPVGIVVALVAVAVGSKVAPELVRDHNWGNWPLRADLWAMQCVLSEATLKRKLAESGDQACAELGEKLREPLAGFELQARARLAEVLDQVRADLGILDQLRRPAR
jgi:hypothetical protein